MTEKLTVEQRKKLARYLRVSQLTVWRWESERVNVPWAVKLLFDDKDHVPEFLQIKDDER